MLKKLAVITFGGYISFKVVANQQQQQDLRGIYSGFSNTFSAIYTFSQSVFDYKYNLSHLEYNTPEYYKERSLIHERVAKRILKLSLENRGVYLKAGQYIGNLERIMPKQNDFYHDHKREYTHTLKVLQDSGPSLPFEEIKIVLEHDLGQKVDDIFSSFEKEAIAAASLAQVHVATIKQTTKKVAVKIQFPSLRTQYRFILFFNNRERYDLLVLNQISKFCDFFIHISGSDKLELNQLFTTFQSALVKELDFRTEANNGLKTKELFKNFPRIHIPSYYEEYCTERILVMEFVEGVKINDIEGIKKMNLVPMDCAQILIEIFGLMIFKYGHVHCDAHPGNIMIRNWAKDQSKPQLVLLDHGFYSELDNKTLTQFRNLWISLAKFDYKKASRIAKELGMDDSHIEYLPLIFFYRTIKSNKKIGENFSKEERSYVRNKELATLESVSHLMRSIPSELLFVIRAANLVGIHNALLGGTTRHRLNTFTKRAMREQYPNIILYGVYWFLLKLRLFVFENLNGFYKIIF